MNFFRAAARPPQHHVMSTSPAVFGVNRGSERDEYIDTLFSRLHYLNREIERRKASNEDIHDAAGRVHALLGEIIALPKLSLPGDTTRRDRIEFVNAYYLLDDRQMVDAANRFLAGLGCAARYRMDATTGRPIVTLAGPLKKEEEAA
jgi:hypothetical protein